MKKKKSFVNILNYSTGVLDTANYAVAAYSSAGIIPAPVRNISILAQALITTVLAAVSYTEASNNEEEK